MISPSRNTEATSLLGGAIRGRDVARLEFYPVDRVVEGPVIGEADSSVVEVIAEPMAERVTAEMRLEAEALEIQARIEAARKESREKAREEWEDELEKRVAEERSRVDRVCEEFVQERQKYFADVEAEVVRLALAIAARVLHREAKIDPLLLAGVVRVALEKVAEGSATVLRVPVEEVEMWRGVASSVEGDVRMKPGECVLETSVGKVELGVSAQLEEIERGFFDLLQQRPS
ncbi:MAG TPA: FliH/SctL family protein [Edaphobacter sp.]|jgi:flagellar assembly protein FliH|nr:FliH/SctL family protein [Edaphobacter sp.]